MSIGDKSLSDAIHLVPTNVCIKNVVLASSAWADSEEEISVDEVETVRTRQRGVSRGDHTPEKRAGKSSWQQLAQDALGDDFVVCMYLYGMLEIGMPYLRSA